MCYRNIFQYQTKKGFVATVSVVILSSIMLLISLGITTTSIDSAVTSTHEYHAAQSNVLRLSCMEVALRHSLTELSYAGDETFLVGLDECAILPVVKVGQTYTVHISATSSEITGDLHFRFDLTDSAIVINEFNP